MCFICERNNLKSSEWISRKFSEKVKNVPSKSRWHFGNVQHWQALTFNLPKIIGQGQRIHRLAEVCALQALTKVLTYCWWVHRMWKQASHGQTDSQVWQLFAYALTAKRHNCYASAYLMSNTSGNLELNFALKSPSFLHLPLSFFFFFGNTWFSLFPVKKQLSCYEWGENPF